MVVVDTNMNTHVLLDSAMAIIKKLYGEFSPYYLQQNLIKIMIILLFGISWKYQTLHGPGLVQLFNQCVDRQQN